MSEEVLCTVEEHFLAKSKEKGTPSVKIKLNSESKGILWADLWLTQDTYKRTAKTLRETFGWGGNDLSLLNGTGELVGKQCIAVTEEEEYGGKIRTKVKFLNRAGAQRKGDISGDEISELNKGFESAASGLDDNLDLPF